MAETPVPPNASIAEHFLVGILLLGMLNGIFSPMTGFVILLRDVWYPSIFLPNSFSFIAMFASLIVSTLSIMVAGVPAAIYEHIFAKRRTTTVSLWIWVSTLALLSLPAVANALSRL